MSNFMDLVKKSGSFKTNRLISQSLEETNFEQKTNEYEKTEKTEKKEKIKNFRHGDSVLVTQLGDSYKGYFANVVDFYPATYELKTEGENYVKTGDLINQDISKKVMTSFGEAEVLEKITRIENVSDVFKFIVYKENNEENKVGTQKQKIGLLVDDTKKIISYLESQGISSDQAYFTFENKNNNFVKELKQDVLIGFMDKLQTDEVQEIVNGIKTVDINKNQTDTLINLLKESVKNWTVDQDYQILFDGEYPIFPKLQDSIFDKTISIVFNKDIIGEKHYMIATGPNKCWTNIYRPDQDYFKIKYQAVVKFKPGQITINKQNRRYATIKKGDYSGKKFLIVKYNHAKILINLTSNNRQLVYKPSDVFYFDIKLTNGNVAEVVDTLLNNTLKIREKDEMTNSFKVNVISENEIAEKLSGFTLSDTENVKENVRTTNDFENFYVPNYDQEFEESIQEVYDDEDETKSNGDYDEPDEQGEGNIEREENLAADLTEGEMKNSYKDTQRTSKTTDDLTSEQKEIVNKIKRAGELMGYYIDEYELLSKVEVVVNCIKKILNISSISSDNQRYIIVLIIIYEAIKNNLDFNINKIVSKLFKSKSEKKNSKAFFTDKDLLAENMNSLVFFNDKLGSEQVQQKISSLLDQDENIKRNRKIIEELILHADHIVQKCLGYNINIKRTYELDLKDLIPLGFNSETGKRFKDEREEKDLLRVQEVTRKFYTSKQFLNDSPLPNNEVDIVWDNDSKLIIKKFIKGLSNKAENQPDAKNAISYIKNNLYRGPFALNDAIDNDTKQSLYSVLRSLKSDIIKFKEKRLNIIKTNSNRVADKRKQIFDDKVSLFGESIDDDNISDESLTKRQKMYNIEKSLRKAQLSVNKDSYIDKKSKKI